MEKRFKNLINFTVIKRFSVAYEEESVTRNYFEYFTLTQQINMCRKWGSSYKVINIRNHLQALNMDNIYPFIVTHTPECVCACLRVCRFLFVYVCGCEGMCVCACFCTCVWGGRTCVCMSVHV